METIFDELEQRGITGHVTSNMKVLYGNKHIRLYLGIDPTAVSLHVGHLVPLITLKRFINYGHKPYILLGGATAMIGDPSFKSAERKFIELDEIKSNIVNIRKQVLDLLHDDTMPAAEDSVEILDNADWYSTMNVLAFLRDVGKNITVNYMTSKESVRKRIDTGISFTEFSYQLLQGYDFYYLYQNYGIALQVGGDDQWGNMTTGIEFMRKKNISDVNVLTIKLLTKDDGSKFGKTEGGAVWLDSKKTSPYAFYQFWMDRTDTEVEKYIKIFSMKDIKDIERLIVEHHDQPERRILQRELAREMTILVHGQQEFLKIENVSNIIFHNGDFKKLLEVDNIMQILQNIPNITIAKNAFAHNIAYYELFSEILIPSFFTSKSDIKRSISAKAVSVNKQRITSCEEKVDEKIFLNDFLLVQSGRKKHIVVFLK